MYNTEKGIAMEMSVLNENLLDMNKGEEYWFGDPCYLLDSSDGKQSVWDSFVSLIDGLKVGTAVLNGHKVLFMDTALGDGEYFVTVVSVFISPGIQSNKKVGVDSGLLAVIPMSLVRELGESAVSNLDSGYVFGLARDAYVVADLASSSWFGAIACETTFNASVYGEQEDDYEYYDYPDGDSE